MAASLAWLEGWSRRSAFHSWKSGAVQLFRRPSAGCLRIWRLHVFAIGDRWGFGRERQVWDAKAFLSLPLTFVLIIATGYVGSFIVLVPGAQTFESLKDLVVLLCIGPFRISGAPRCSAGVHAVGPDRRRAAGIVLSWAEGYFFWTAFVWMAYQLIGLNPDFRQARTWWRYGAFVALIMLFDPVMWGFSCSANSRRTSRTGNISSALFFHAGRDLGSRAWESSGGAAACPSIRLVLGGNPEACQSTRDWKPRTDPGRPAAATRGAKRFLRSPACRFGFSFLRRSLP
jgi:hypothetical protein